MAHYTDWLPSRRADILTMARTWVSVFAEDTTDSEGKAVKKYVAWSIPAETFTELGTLFGAAEAALTKAQEQETRTPVTNAACKTAFDALVGAMRNLKKRYLYSPPLTHADLVSLGLKPRDATPTRSGAPTAEVTIETYLVGRHQLGLKFIYITGSPSDPANKEFRVHYKVVAPGETPPATPEDLPHSFPEKRKTCVWDLKFGDSGKTAYMAVQLENERLTGPWGPLVSALIP